jgi:hypothetical protein
MSRFIKNSSFMNLCNAFKKLFYVDCRFEAHVMENKSLIIRLEILIGIQFSTQEIIKIILKLEMK